MCLDLYHARFGPPYRLAAARFRCRLRFRATQLRTLTCVARWACNCDRAMWVLAARKAWPETRQELWARGLVFSCAHVGTRRRFRPYGETRFPRRALSCLRELFAGRALLRVSANAAKISCKIVTPTMPVIPDKS